MRAAPAARSPCAPPWGWRWTKERVVEDADPYRAGAATRGLRSSRRPGGGGTPPLQGLAERGKAGGDRDGGTSGTPSPTGLVRRHNARSDPAPGGGRTQPIRGAGGDREGGTPTPSGRARGVGMRGKPNVNNEKQRPPPAACARRRGPQRRQKRRPLRGGVFVDMGVWKRKIKFMWAHCVIVPFLSIKK